MIRSQRKRHLYTWLLLAVLLPVGMVAAYSSLPALTEPLEQNSPERGQELAAGSADGFRVSLRQMEDTRWLNVQVEKPIQSPAANVYIQGDAPGKGMLLGKLQAVGTYTFAVPDSEQELALNLEVYDGIKQTTLQTIILKP